MAWPLQRVDTFVPEARNIASAPLPASSFILQIRRIVHFDQDLHPWLIPSQSLVSLSLRPVFSLSFFVSRSLSLYLDLSLSRAVDRHLSKEASLTSTP
jgi:hypothetical protein